MNYVITEAPKAEPISLEEAKAHLRVDGEDEDALISGLIKAARNYAENYTNRAFVTQTITAYLDFFPARYCIELPKPNLQNVVHIKYYDSDNAEHTFSSDNYFVDDISFVGRVALNYGKSWPSFTPRRVNAVEIEYVAGYGDAVKVPESIKQAMLLLVGHWYHNREAEGQVGKELEFSVKALLNLERVINV